MSLSLDVSEDTLRLYAEKPHAMVEELFGVKPDLWQLKVLEAFPHTPRIAMVSCTGPGKTAVLAWLTWNFLLTRPHAVIGCASVNKPNLMKNLWPELSRWYAKSELLQKIFDVQAEQITNREHPKTWWAAVKAWAQDANAEQIGNALRGLHAEYVMWTLDETGGYPDGVLPVCEAIFSGFPIEAHIVQAGNPTHLTGALYFAHRHRDSWMVIEITADPDDPMRTPRVSIEHARQQIKDWGGPDNPWVRTNIFGRFPQASLNALIGPEEIEEAMGRYWRAHDIGEAPRILGVDIAAEGDDKSCIARRHGIQMFPFTLYRNLDPGQGASQVNTAWSEFDADACFLDDTGGFGSGWKYQLAQLGRTPIGIKFSSRATDDENYANKRAEMYFRFVQWIRNGGALPDCRELVAQLTATSYTHLKDRLLLAPKDEIKAKIGQSPDEADAAALTFAEQVTAKQRRRSLVTVQADDIWNPFAEPNMGFNQSR